MIESLYYNIHDLVKIKINRPKHSDWLKDVNLRFSYFQTGAVENPDIIVNIGKFAPKNKDCEVIDHKFFVKKNYLYCRDAEKSAKWEIEINGFEEGKTIVNFNGRILGLQQILTPDLLFQQYFLRTLIELKLFQKNAVLSHAAGIAKNNKGILFAGRGSAFKTSITADFVKRGWSFLGEDFVIIRKGKVLSFPAAVMEYFFRMTCLPSEELRREHYLQDLLAWFNFLRKNQNYKKLDLKIANASPINSIYFIERTNSQGIKIKKNLKKSTCVKKLVLNHELEFTMTNMQTIHLSGMYNYLLAYSFVFPFSKTANFWDWLAGFYSKTISAVPCHLIEIPFKYDSNVFNKLSDLILKGE